MCAYNSEDDKYGKGLRRHDLLSVFNDHIDTRARRAGCGIHSNNPATTDNY